MAVVKERVLPHGGSPGRLLVDTLRNRRIVQTAVHSTRPDVIYCHGIDGVGFEVYRTAVGAGLPSLTAVGDTWLAQAWRDLARFDPWCGVASAGRRMGLRRMAKQAIGAVGKGVGLFVGSRPTRFSPVVTISRFLADDLVASGVPCRDEIPVVPTPAHHSFFLEGKPIGHSGARSEVLRWHSSP